MNSQKQLNDEQELNFCFEGEQPDDGEEELNIYFAASIRGGMQDATLYEQLAKTLAEYGHVFSDYTMGKENVNDLESILTDEFIFHRDMGWLDESDVVVAEVTVPSLGVGYEIATAVHLDRDILCLYRPSEMNGKRVSAIIAGHPEVTLRAYHTFVEARFEILQFMCGLYPRRFGTVTQ